MALTHWKALTNPDYIGEYAFQPGQKIVATISHVTKESVTSPDGKKECKPVVHFKERDIKPLILNSTNANTISKLAHAPHVEKWSGLKITMGVKKVKAFGEWKNAVRVEDVALPTESPAEIPPCADCGQPIGPYGEKPPEWVAQYTASRYGVCLCIECGMKRKEREEAEKTNEAD